MTDIIERLRKLEMLTEIGRDRPEIYRDAADEIERLRAALKPFANLASPAPASDGDTFIINSPSITQIRAAKAALENK